MGQTTGGVRTARIRVGGIESEEELGYADPMEAERAEIGRTRSSMGETIDEIQSRLTPGHLAESARDTVVDMAGGMRHRVGGAVRANPVPAMITAVGLGYLLFRAFSGGSGNGSANGSDLGSSDM